MKDIAEWIDSKLAERKWADADLARAAGIYTGTIANIKTRNRIGPEAARKIAAAFEMREDELFYELGLLSQKPGEVVIHDPILRMSEQERIAARVFIEKMFGHLLEDDATVEPVDKSQGGEGNKRRGRGKQTDRTTPEKAKSK